MNRSSFRWISQRARDLGPYLLVELLLPGGTLLALLLWLSQHRRLQPKDSPWRVGQWRHAPMALMHAVLRDKWVCSSPAPGCGVCGRASV